MKMIDLFSGIGGFHKGFQQAGFRFDWVGFSEIDKYASAVYKYNFKESEELGDIRLIQPGRDLPDNIDILCGGFPCQAFSIAGKRQGFDDTRGTLFFEIARILRHYRDSKKPIPCLVLENVKGLLSHDSGRTFATIYRVLSDIGYTIEFQLLNTRWWLPQNRERIYIVGYIGNRGRSQIFPIGEDGKQLNKNRLKGRRVVNGLDSNYYKGADGKRTMIQIGTIGKDSEATRVYDADGISRTIKDGVIRRLTPVECNRLQGFSDDHNKYGVINGKVVEMSDTQRYKQVGNAVTVDVVQAVAEQIKKSSIFK